MASVSADKIPLLHFKRRVGGTWEYRSNLTSVYLDILHEIATSGTTFKDKNALLTSVGKGSIGVEILKGLGGVGYYKHGRNESECTYLFFKRFTPKEEEHHHH